MNQNNTVESITAMLGGLGYMLWTGISEYTTQGIMSLVNFGAILTAISSQHASEIIANSLIGVGCSFVGLKICHGIWYGLTYLFDRITRKFKK